MRLVLGSSFHFVSNHDAIYGGQFVVLKVNWATDVIIQDTSSNVKLIDFGGCGGGAFYVAPLTTLKDTNGNNLNWKDYVGGIVRHSSTNIPINVVSNIEL